MQDVLTAQSNFDAAMDRVESGDFSFEAVGALCVAHGEKLVSDSDALDRRPSKFNALGETGILAAEYTAAGRGRTAVLTINRIAGGRRTFLNSHEVAGKREARAIAAHCGATPWNF